MSLDFLSSLHKSEPFTKHNQEIISVIRREIYAPKAIFKIAVLLAFIGLSLMVSSIQLKM